MIANNRGWLNTYPAKAGIQERKVLVDSRLRVNDRLRYVIIIE